MVHKRLCNRASSPSLGQRKDQRSDYLANVCFVIVLLPIIYPRAPRFISRRTFQKYNWELCHSVDTFCGKSSEINTAVDVSFQCNAVLVFYTLGKIHRVSD